MRRGSTTDYYEADGLGSVTSLTDSTGAMAESYTYDAYGNLTAGGTALNNPFRYTGREWDPEAGLYYYRARYFDQGTGRFGNEDPIRAGVNFYTYASNNPTLRRDPSGLYDGWDLLRDAGTFSESFTDVLTFGSASRLNDALGANVAVDRCSWVHTSGTIAGIAFTTVIGGALGAEAAEANAGKKGFEFSHWIPKRSFQAFERRIGIDIGEGRSIFNGNFVSSKLAYLTDAYRFPAPKGSALRWGAKLPALAQQSIRIPWVYDGAAAGAAYGAVSQTAGQQCECE
jgi:RHS repeat-associated protein